MRERKNDKKSKNLKEKSFFQAKRSACLKKHKKESHKRSKKKTTRERKARKAPHTY